MSNYVIDYVEQSKGFKFYNPTPRNIFKMGIVTFFEDIEFWGINEVKDFVVEEELVSIL